MKYLLSVVQKKGYVEEQVFKGAETDLFTRKLANKPICTNGILTDKHVTRGLQEFNFVFPLEAVVLSSLIQCWQQLFNVSTANNQNQLYVGKI